MTEAAMPTSPSARPRAKAAVVLLAVAIAAAIAGAALDRLVFASAPPERGRRFGSSQSGMRGRQPSPEMRKRFSDRMAKDLGLTPQQQVRVDSVMQRQMDGTNRVTRTMQPAIDSITRVAQVAMDSILTPEQRVKVKEWRSRGRGRGRPMGDGRSPAPPTRN